MKKIVSVSLGSSTRDHEVTVSLLGESFHIRRIGTDGDFKKASALLESLDGHVDAIGLGGLDVYLYAGQKRYPLRDGIRLMEMVKNTPVVDGSGLKNTLEKDAIKYVNEHLLPLKGKRVLMVSALDRFGMAQAFSQYDTKMVFGDFIFALGIDHPMTSLSELEMQAEKLLPEIGKLPIGFIYPIGKNQEQPSTSDSPFSRYYLEADVIAGDFHFIRKFLPQELPGRTIITNTVTLKDVEMFRSRGVECLVTTTPEFEGRSFGTNVLEAALLSMLNKRWEEVTPEDYARLLDELRLTPRILRLNSDNLARMVK